MTRVDGRARSDDLRRRLGAGESVLMPGVWDPLSARIVASAGFSTAFLSGFAVSGTLLGRPDVGHLTQTEMDDAARRVCATVPELNVIVDADTGYGNAMNTIRTVELWEAAGAAGMFIEDQVWPKRCGHMDDKTVVPRDEWLSKLRAACEHREHLVVTARTDARAAVSLDEAIERGKMARDLGVDAVFVEAPQSLAELDAIASAITGVTLVANMVEKGKTPLLTPSELADRGFRLIVSPLSILLAATRAMVDAAAHLHAHGTMRDRLDDLSSFDEFTDLVGLPEHRSTEQRFA
jgi:2-methylisocitrate lyase-like PEP mutase family enzyme